jgi:hypothetical protein
MYSRGPKQLKADDMQWIRQQQSCERIGESAGPHRDLSAGHVFKGVTWESARKRRTCCL